MVMSGSAGLHPVVMYGPATDDEAQGCIWRLRPRDTGPACRGGGGAGLRTVGLAGEGRAGRRVTVLAREGAAVPEAMLASAVGDRGREKLINGSHLSVDDPTFDVYGPNKKWVGLILLQPNRN